MTTRIAAVATALPKHRYPQAELTEAFAGIVAPRGQGRAVLERLHAATGVRTRHLALPIEDYAGLDGFRAANDAYLRVDTDLGEQAVRGALAGAGLVAGDVDLILTVSVTGIASPSLDTRIAPRLGLRPDVKRLPVFGLGCVAGAAGVARLHDLLRGDPDGVAVLLSVDLCSLTLQRDDPSVANFVASGLFGDGAAAVVAVGERRARRLGLTAGPTVVDTRSRLYPDTQRVMGWDIGGSGFRIVLDAGVAEVVEAHLGDDVRAFLDTNDLTTAHIGTWVAHPGGPKVLHALKRALDLPDDALQVTWIPWPRSATSPPPPCSTSSSTPSPTVARPRGPQACCSPWDRASAPNSSCSPGDPGEPYSSRPATGIAPVDGWRGKTHG